MKIELKNTRGGKLTIIGGEEELEELTMILDCVKDIHEKCWTVKSAKKMSLEIKEILMISK